LQENSSMSPTFKKVLYAGVHEGTPEYHARAIIICNTIAFIAIILGAVFLAYASLNGWSRYDSLVLTAIVLLAVIPFFNFLGMVNLSRFLLPLVIPFMSFVVIFIGRLQHPEKFTYARSPGMFCMILATAAIPILIFSIKEKKIMFSCLAINFLFYASLDVLLRYYSSLRALPTTAEYFSANLSLHIAYFLLVGSVMSLKEITDEYETKNDLLITRLNKKNEELEKVNLDLHELNNNIETQNEEIQSQREQLIQSQDHLILANHEIERQNIQLEEQNEFLSKSLDEKSNDLLLTNQQLVSHNNELQQFSYTISHNLRGPVASMLGLINLHNLAETPQEGKQILGLLEQSTLSLETVIRDLNKIIDIRNDKFSIYEKVSLLQELDLIKNTLHPYITANEAQIESIFQEEELTSVKAYINSILYNLISNAIQYRAFDRNPRIQITSKLLGQHIQIEVSDNGLGIDLSKFKGDLFKLYKRFHTHTQGKGLGLYLVKQQVDKLHGHIDVESRLNSGSTFRISIPVKIGHT
jgi:signal transduction histidine kinase